ncbi:hypothetical protein WDW86_19780 [Bdellovibrionota bacterium FG-2]
MLAPSFTSALVSLVLCAALWSSALNAEQTSSMGVCKSEEFPSIAETIGKYQVAISALIKQNPRATTGCSPGKNLFEVIPQLQDLQEGRDVPQWILSKYDSKTIARNLVLRLEKLRGDKRSDTSPNGSYYDFCKDTSIKLVFPEKVIEGVIKSGFLNSHQTRRFAGDTNMGVPESKMAGVVMFAPEEFKRRAYEVLPKYAYLSMEKQNPQIWKSRLDRQYGNVVAVMKDEIKDRVTFSAGNSYMIQEGVRPLSYKTPAPFVEPDYERWPILENREWGHHWEAQIWGKLGIEDVAYFMVYCPYFCSIPFVRVEALKRANVPIYQCKNDGMNSRVVPGKRLFP